MLDKQFFLFSRYVEGPGSQDCDDWYIDSCPVVHLWCCESIPPYATTSTTRNAWVIEEENGTCSVISLSYVGTNFLQIFSLCSVNSMGRFCSVSQKLHGAIWVQKLLLLTASVSSNPCLYLLSCWYLKQLNLINSMNVGCKSWPSKMSDNIFQSFEVCLLLEPHFPKC